MRFTLDSSSVSDISTAPASSDMTFGFRLNELSCKSRDCERLDVFPPFEPLPRYSKNYCREANDERPSAGPWKRRAVNRVACIIVVTLIAVAACTACSSKQNDSRQIAPVGTEWSEAVRALDPMRVYTHRMNTVVVLESIDGVEHGKYIYNPVSSYWPQSGDDGFTFISGPDEAPQFGVGSAVFEFRRVPQ
jgi:hypothetical protein